MVQKSQKELIDQTIKKLLARRKELGLSHEQLAQATGLSRAAISFIEARKREPTLKSLLLIADALDCDLGALITGARRKKPTA